MKVILDNIARNQYTFKLLDTDQVIATLHREQTGSGTLYTIDTGFCAGMQAYNYSELKEAVKAAYIADLNAKRVQLVKQANGHYTYTEANGNQWIVERWSASCWVVLLNNDVYHSTSKATKKAAADYITRHINEGCKCASVFRETGA
jgi:hypothetical protein